jgi:hypothetical protein
LTGAPERSTVIVGVPRIEEERGEIVIAADVRVDKSGVEMPPTMWFRFPQSNRDYISDASDAFAVAALPVAMLLGENLVVEGRVSPRLAHGLREYQVAYRQWWPQRYSMVDVRYGDVAPDGEGSGEGVGCTCSGGVDSFYSIWRHLPENEPVPGICITHCLIINGFNFDIDLDRSGEFSRLVETFEPLLARHGVALLVSRQNAQAFLEATGKVTKSSGIQEVGLICAALMLGRLYQRFYVPGVATYRHEENYPHYFHPSILHLLSSDRTQILVDGGDATRTEKTVAIAEWEETHSTLRVCWRPAVFNADTGLIENCCRCPKCIRTMVTLEMAGALDRFKTFPLPVDRRLVRASHQVSTGEKLYYRDMLDLARKTGRSDLARDLRYARFRSRLEAAVRHRILRRPAPRH